MKKGIYILLVCLILMLFFELGRRSGVVTEGVVVWPSDKDKDSLSLLQDSLEYLNDSLLKELSFYEIEQRRLRYRIDNVYIPEWESFNTGLVDSGRFSLDSLLSDFRRADRYHFGDTAYWRLQRATLRDSVIRVMRGTE